VSAHRPDSRTGLRRGGLAVAAALLAALASFAAGCRERPPSAEEVVGSRPNVVLVVLCSFRADRLGSLGNPRELTPFLDRLAAEGAVFENAVSASSWTKPSTTSVLTGLTPGVHGMLDFYGPEVIAEAMAGGQPLERRVLPESFATIPAELERSGYDTFCRVNNVHAGDFFGLTRGCQDQVTRFGLSTDEMIGDLASWLGRRESERPFFAYLFSRQVHSPFHPAYEDLAALRPDGEAPAPGELDAYGRDVGRRVWELIRAEAPVPEPLRRAWIDLYDAQFPALDRALSRLPALLEGADARRNTLILVTADHGERLFEDGRIDHGGLRLDQAVLHAPLLAWGAGVPAGRRVTPVVRSIDLLPTVLDLAGAERPAVLQGESLVPLIWPGKGEPAPRAAFSSAGKGSFAVRLGRYKLRVRRGQGRQLYDLETDPWEEHDLFAEEPRTARRLQRELSRWLAEEAALSQAFEAASTRELPPEVVEELRALGYL
jgi:arylsulfatase A-like enzyme